MEDLDITISAPGYGPQTVTLAPEDQGPQRTQLFGFKTSMVTVPEGEVWEIPAGAVLETERASVVVYGDLHVPGSGNRQAPTTMRIGGARNSDYKGGDPADPETEFGLYILGHGRIFYEGMPVQHSVGGPIRPSETASHETWLETDDIRVAPLGGADGPWPSIALGDPLPIGEEGYTREAVNFSRDVLITGTPSETDPEDGNVHYMNMSDRPSPRNYAAVKYFGVGRIDGMNSHTVLGRYADHHHKREDGSRGESSEGMLWMHCRGWGLVPHASHGMKYIKPTVYDCRDTGIVWDTGDLTHDLLIDEPVIINVYSLPSFRTFRSTAVSLKEGTNLTLRNSTTAGFMGRGIAWPEGADNPFNVWTLEGLHVIHNGGREGAFAWQNDGEHHDVGGLIIYNVPIGIDSGAYANRYFWHDSVLRSGQTAVMVHAKSVGADPPLRYTRLDIAGFENGFVFKGIGKIGSHVPAELVGNVLNAVDGSYVVDTGGAVVIPAYDITDNTVDGVPAGPQHVTVQSVAPGTTIRFQDRATGTAQQMVWDEQGEVSVTGIGLFPVYEG